MYKSKDFTELRNWTLNGSAKVNIEELKEIFEELVIAATLPVYIVDIEIDDNLPAFKIKSSSNSSYMGVYVYCKSQVVGMALEGKGEQIKAPELEKLFYKAAGTVAGLYDGYHKGRNVMHRFGVGGMTGSLAAGAGVAVGAAIGGSVRLISKGVKVLLRDQEAYDKEMAFYNLALGIGDYLIGGSDPSNIISKLRNRAEDGNEIAQYLMGSSYAEGRGVEQNLGEAVKWFALAADNNEKRSREVLAVEYLYGEKKYSIEEKNKGLKYLKELADNGDEDAASSIIDIYGFGSVEGISTNLSKMVDAAEVYADRGNTYAILVLAHTYDTFFRNEKEDDECYKNDSKAAIYYQYIVALENCEYREEAAMSLANMYLEGRGVDKSPENSLKYTKIAAQCGNMEAKAMLTYYLTCGIGTEKDHFSAQKLCKELVQKGNLDEKAIAYYCSYKIFDEIKKFKKSMEYARKCLDCKVLDENKAKELQEYLSEKESVISKMTDDERREYLQERKPIFNGFKERQQDKTSSGKKNVIIVIALILCVLIGAFLIKNLGKNESDSRESPTIESSNYKVTSERQEKNIFINDDTEILVRVEYDLPTITGNDVLNEGVQKWSETIEEQADQMCEFWYSGFDYDDLDFMEPHESPEFYGTEYPVYYYYKKTIYDPQTDDFFRTPRADDKVLSIVNHE